MHARWTVTRESVSDQTIIDSAKMKYLIERAQDDLSFVGQIKKSLTGISRSHSEAVDRLNLLENKLRRTLDEASELMTETVNTSTRTPREVA